MSHCLSLSLESQPQPCGLACRTHWPAAHVPSGCEIGAAHRPRPDWSRSHDQVPPHLTRMQGQDAARAQQRRSDLIRYRTSLPWAFRPGGRRSGTDRAHRPTLGTRRTDTRRTLHNAKRKTRPDLVPPFRWTVRSRLAPCCLLLASAPLPRIHGAPSARGTRGQGELREYFLSSLVVSSLLTAGSCGLAGMSGQRSTNFDMTACRNRVPHSVTPSNQWTDHNIPQKKTSLITANRHMPRYTVWGCGESTVSRHVSCTWHCLITAVHNFC